MVLRFFFVSEWRFLEFNLRCLEALDDCVGRRCLGFFAASLRRLINFSRAAARFCTWLLLLWSVIITIPFFVIFRPARTRIWRNIDGEMAEEFFALKRSCTPVETLLTCCPPGPRDRMNVSSISFSEICSVVVILIICGRLIPKTKARLLRARR